MSIGLGKWTSERKQEQSLRFEKARRTALGIAQGVILSDADRHAQTFGGGRRSVIDLARERGVSPERTPQPTVPLTPPPPSASQGYQTPASVQMREFPGKFKARQQAVEDFLRQQGLPVETLTPEQRTALPFVDNETVLSAVRHKNLAEIAPSEQGALSEPNLPGAFGILGTPAEAASTIGTLGAGGILKPALAAGVTRGLASGSPQEAATAAALTGAGGLALKGAGAAIGAGIERAAPNLERATTQAGGIRGLLQGETGGSRFGVGDEGFLRNAADAVAKPPASALAEAIKAAGKATPEQRAMFAAERAKRTGAGAAILQRGIAAGEGAQAFGKAKGALAGEFPRPQFAVPEFPEETMHQLVQDIGTSNVSFYTKLHAQDALEELARGRIPEPAKLSALKQAVSQGGEELVKAALQKRSLGTKAWAETISLLGLPQKLKASYDLGTRFRQGLVLGWSHPRQWLSNWKPVKDSFFSEQAAREVMTKVEQHPWFSIEGGERAGLGFKDQGGHIFDWESFTTGTERVGGFQGMQESVVNRATDKIPGLLGSQRSFAVDLNKAGVEVYGQEAQAMWNAGVRDPDQYAALTKVIDHARGYGSFNPGQIAQGVHAFFSGRNLVARFQTVLDPLTQPGSLLTPSARRLAAKNLVGMVAGDMSVLGLIGAAGAATGLATVEVNPLKPGADWLKVKVGNTRIDPWGGFLPLARLIARMGAAGVTETGAKDTGYSASDIKRELGTFFANKEAPLVRLFTDVAGLTQPFTDRKLASPATLVDLFSPFIAQDVYEAVKEHGLIGVSAAVPSATGIGVQSYAPKATQLLNEIPQYNGLDENTKWEIIGNGGFWDRAEQVRSDAIQNGVPKQQVESTPFEHTLRELGMAEGKGKDFVDWAVKIRSEKESQQLLNKDWLQFILDHEAELRQQRPNLFNHWLDEFINLNRNKAVGQ